MGEIENREKPTENQRNLNYKQQTVIQKNSTPQKSERGQAINQIRTEEEEEDQYDQQQPKNGVQGVGEVVNPQHQESLD